MKQDFNRYSIKELKDLHICCKFMQDYLQLGIEDFDRCLHTVAIKTGPKQFVIYHFGTHYDIKITKRGTAIILHDSEVKADGVEKEYLLPDDRITPKYINE